MQTVLNESESEVWPQIAPMLDAAMAGLNETDRLAVVLRFFDGKSMKEVGAALGANENAAKKRISRALEKLRKFFTKRGVVSTATIIAGAISANSVQAAPTTLAKSVTAVVLAKGAAASVSTLTLIQGTLKVMAWEKMKMALVIGAGILLAVGTSATYVVQHELQNAMPQIHIIKTRIVEIQNDSADFLNSFPGITNDVGILEDNSAQAFLKTLQSESGYKTLSKLELPINRGAIRMVSTTSFTIITNLIYLKTKDAESIYPQTGTVETGPVLNVAPMVVGAGQTKLTITALITYFLGYADTSKSPPRHATDSTGQQIDLPTVLPLFQIKNASATTTLMDGQTLVMILPKAEKLSFSKPDAEEWVAKTLENSKQYVNSENTVIVLLTPGMVGSTENQTQSEAK